MALVMTNTDLKSKLQAGLQEIMQLQGALVCGLGDWQTGQSFAIEGIDSPLFPNSKIETAIAGNARVIQAKFQVAQTLEFVEKIDQISITLSTQRHLIKPLSVEPYFIYLALNRKSCSMSSAVLKLMQIDKQLSSLLR